jgi:hypothetical protein
LEGLVLNAVHILPLFQTAADFEKIQGALLFDLVDFPFDLIRV